MVYNMWMHFWMKYNESVGWPMMCKENFPEKKNFSITKWLHPPVKRSEHNFYMFYLNLKRLLFVWSDIYVEENLTILGDNMCEF